MKKLLVTFILFTLFTFYVSAHPHMFIDSAVTFEFDKNNLSGFWIDWYFDKVFTEMIFLDYDTNGDREYNEAEVKEIEKGAFSNLENYNYFIFIKSHEKNYPAEEVEYFSAYVKDERLVYHFFIPFEIKTSTAYQTIKIAIYDKTFFCDICYIKQEPIRLTGISNVDCSFQIKENRDNKIFYNSTDTSGGRANGKYSGLSYPLELILEFKKIK